MTTCSTEIFLHMEYTYLQVYTIYLSPITLENQMMEDGILCILKLSVSIIQSCFNRHSVLTHLAQRGPIAAVTAI
jgi:hypothetical protein